MGPKTDFSNQARLTVEAFAASMEFTAMPEQAADGSYNFILEHDGTLSLVSSRDRSFVVLALGRAPVSDDESFIRRFFTAAALEAATTGPLHAGIAPDGGYYYATAIPVDRFDLPTLETNLNALIAAHDAVA